MKRKRHICALLAASAVVAIFAGSAKGLTGHYWGYNNLTASNPPNATCSYNGITWPAGVACSGWGNWDYSWVDWTSGSGTFIYGFICQSDGVLHGGEELGPGDPYATYSWPYFDSCPGHYNHAAVAHVSGTYDYLQAGHTP